MAARRGIVTISSSQAAKATLLGGRPAEVLSFDVRFILCFAWSRSYHRPCDGKLEEIRPIYLNPGGQEPDRDQGVQIPHGIKAASSAGVSGVSVCTFKP